MPVDHEPLEAYQVEALQGASAWLKGSGAGAGAGAGSSLAARKDASFRSGASVGQPRREAASFDLAGGRFDLLGGPFDLLGGSCDLLGGSLDLPGGSFDLPGGSFAGATPRLSPATRRALRPSSALSPSVPMAAARAPGMRPTGAAFARP